MKVTGDWIDVPETRKVFEVLESEGFQAFFVGGCVRNDLLGQPVADIDIATDARPTNVIDLMANAGLRTAPTGLDHGTITVIAEGVAHEVTTFRKDVATDGRRATVAYATDVRDDARRRDFTMNALYARIDGTVVDPLGGLPDLRARKVRFIEDAETRIREDYLRILRFFRFYAWYGDPQQGPNPDGLAACAALADGVEILSRERIGAELCKLLAAPNPAPAMAAMRSAGVLARVLPGADDRLLAALVHLEGDIAPDYTRRLAILGGENVESRLRLSRSDVRRVEQLTEATSNSAPAAELGYRHGVELGRDILLLRAAISQQMVADDDEADLALGASVQFPVSASDLMPDFEGPALGQKLTELEQKWIASRFTLTREELLA